MIQSIHPFDWPLSFKVPLLVGALMVLLGGVVSNAVLLQLSNTQENHIRHLSEAYLNGVSSAVLPHVLRSDVWESFDVLDRARSQYGGLYVKNTVIALNDNTILAASNPVLFPTDNLIPKMLNELFEDGKVLVIDEIKGNAWMRQILREGGHEIGNIYAEVDISEQLKIRRNTLYTLIAFTMAMTLLMAGLGYALVSRMLRPLSVLGDHVNAIADGDITDIDEATIPRRKGEFHLLMKRFNAMAQALRDRETLSQRLAEEEKLAILGKLASGMAHEVNNPLGGMGNAIDTIRKHGDDDQVRNRSLDILERGLDGIAKVTQATLATYKGSGKADYLTRRDLEDIEFLVHHKITRRQIDLKWRNETPPKIQVDASVTRQIVLNLLLNACEASPKGGQLHFHASVTNDHLVIVVEDQGPGIPDAVAAQLKGENMSVLSQDRHGLGAWTVGTLLKRLGGHIDIQIQGVGQTQGAGTKLTVLLPLDHEIGAQHAIA